MVQMTAIGRVGGDANVKTVGNRVVINFAIATNRKKTNRDTGELIEETRWINCALWRDEAGSIANYLKKGQQVFIQGEPTWSVYKKKDNRPGVDMSLVIQRIELLGSKKEESGKANAQDDTDYQWDEPTTPEGEEVMPWDKEEPATAAN